MYYTFRVCRFFLLLISLSFASLLYSHSGLLMVKSNYKLYNSAPSITSQPEITTEAKQLIDFIKAQENGQKILDRMEKQGIGFFTIHRHCELNPECIMLEKKVISRKKNKPKYVTDIQPLSSINSAAVHPMSWIAKNEYPCPFDYSTKDATTPLALDDASIIESVIKFICMAGKQNHLGVRMLDKKGVKLKNDEIYLESNNARRDNPNQVTSEVEVVKKSYSREKNSIPTAMRVTMGEEQTCEELYGCIPEGNRHDFGPIDHKITWD